MRSVPSFLDLTGRRLAAGQSSHDMIEVERILAVARLLLAFSSILAIYFDPTRPTRYSAIALGLLLFYAGNSLAILVIVSAREEITNRFAVLAHIGDLLWPAAISIVTNGTSSPFFFYFSFALLAAAFRWGMRATLATTLTIIVMVVGEASVQNSRSALWIFSKFDLNGFIQRETYLAIFGVLVGYLAETEKRRRVEAISAGRISREARVDIGLNGTLRATLQEMMTLFDAREIVLTATDSTSDQGYVWRIERPIEGREALFALQPLDAELAQRYLFAMPEGAAAAAWRNSDLQNSVATDADGNTIRDRHCVLGPEVIAHHPHKLLLAGTVSVARGIETRLFLVDPRLGGQPETQLRILQELMNSVAPAVYNVYLLRRLRSRAASAERGRVARELHDGVVQSLHAIAFRLYALRTSPAINADDRGRELLEIQELVQHETANLRNLIRQLEPLDFDPRRLLDFLSRMIEQFRYDTGIDAKFVCDYADLDLPPTTCREIAGIVREALANVLKHSRAHNVLVRLDKLREACVLTIEDDGRGFEFSGRVSSTELKNSRRGPLVIKERVRAIGGDLTIESNPGQGARLEIKVPRDAELRLA